MGFLIFQEATPHRVSHHVLILRLSRCLGVCHCSLAATLFESTVILVILEILHIVPAEEGPKELRQERCRSYLRTCIGHDRARQSQKKYGEEGSGVGLAALGPLVSRNVGAMKLGRLFGTLYSHMGFSFRPVTEIPKTAHGVCLGSDILWAEAQSQNEAAPT
jgi:hypothetical protein